MRDCFPPFIVAGGGLTRPGQVGASLRARHFRDNLCRYACDQAFDVRLLLRSEIQSDDRVQEPPLSDDKPFCLLKNLGRIEVRF